MGLSRSLLKLLLVIFCAVFLIAGLGVTSVAIWTIAEKVFLSHIIGTQLFSAASYVLLFGGLIVISSAIVGLLAVFKERKLLIMIFLVLLIVMFLVIFIGAILAAVFRGELENKMIQSMKDTLVKSYGGDQSGDSGTTAAWDKVQKDLRCCAVTRKDWAVYRQTPFFNKQEYYQDSIKKYVPATCCVFDLRKRDYVDVDSCQYFPLGPPNNPTTDLTNSFLYYEGCYEAAKAFVLQHSEILVAVGFVCSIIMIAAIVLAVFFFRRVTFDQEEEKKRRYTERDRAHDEEENRRL